MPSVTRKWQVKFTQQEVKDFLMNEAARLLGDEVSTANAEVQLNVDYDSLKEGSKLRGIAVEVYFTEEEQDVALTQEELERRLAPVVEDQEREAGELEHRRKVATIDGYHHCQREDGNPKTAVCLLELWGGRECKGGCKIDKKQRYDPRVSCYHHF